MILVGIACSRADEQKMKSASVPLPEGSPIALFSAVPLLVDPRLAPGQADAFYDKDLWLNRCREQREFDSQTLPKGDA